MTVLVTVSKQLKRRLVALVSLTVLINEATILYFIGIIVHFYGIDKKIGMPLVGKVGYSHSLQRMVGSPSLYIPYV